MSRGMYRMRMMFFVILAAAAVMVCGLFLSMSHRSYTAYAAGREIRYESYVVEAGDTLWSIADRYQESSFSNREDYIREVMRVNQLTSSNIYEGDLLVIPESGVSFHCSSDAE